MKLIKEPLLHFALVGALLFITYGLVQGYRSLETTGEPVEIGGGELRWLTETFKNQWQRLPDDQELRGLASNLIEEELLAREAYVLGLDKDDTIVRRRLAQKLLFLIEDSSRFTEPSETELRALYAANIMLFRTQSRISFKHIFFDRQKRRDAVSDAKAAFVSITTGSHQDVSALGDRLLLGSSFENMDEQSLAASFGAGFARTVIGLEPGMWSGPIRSGYGIHLVQVTHRMPGKERRFEEVRDHVEREWRRSRKDAAKAAYLVKLRDKYGVTVDDRIEALVSLAKGIEDR
ncbi:MAG TPA: peptidylprolyl isomerase [Aestuariivirgaceae bacterium]|nr:peptidylprolyl isomerase [Aestuariivirgaceae bacterium]